jgi:hypothetical protein
MNKYCLFVILVTSYLTGCTGSKSIANKEETMAASHMNIADSLAAKSALRKATNEYLLVAKQYPSTKYYTEAVYKTAVLYSNPLNQAANDSASLYWFRVYLSLPNSTEQKEKATIYVTMLERLKLLREELRKLREVDVQVNKRGTKK